MRREYALLVCLAACGKSEPPASAASGDTPALAGFYQTEGYGIQVELTVDSLLKMSEVTAISCVPSFLAKAVPAPPGAAAAYRLAKAPLTFLVLRDSTPGKIRIHFNGAASDMVARRLDGRLPICDKPTPNTPVSNFDVFAATWSEHYPFFADKKTDWAAVVAANRPKITDQTKPESLFAVLRGMIEPLQDAHSGISAPDLSLRFNGSRSGADRLDRSQFDRAYALVEKKYLNGPLRRFCEGKIEFAMIAKDVGYLRLRSFFGYHADESFESGLAALEAALDTIFTDAKRWRGLLIDVRINGGGADPYGLAIAGRLTDRRYVAYAKQARMDPTDPGKWTPEQVSVVTPSTRPGFRGPVVELIGIQSVSAAETFTQALLGRRPKVVRVGENTQGVFSDVLGRTLPNGWRFGLPNERFVTDGKSYDGPGIPPDVQVPVFPPADLESGRDRSLEAALKLIPAAR